ncbi:DUF4037 domain-containing protein [Microbispora sp. ATCC PTA-5024]|uniref:DUF4037 domain-containing protein n=1 Tax=Microbispora sp. ATCC PTA-5024 TaxID=316330 RepID=UPI0003DBCF5B|nr:DUF4037 domain-containing protein [Microbispora sp. ATCC PTA-5024]ETK30618.1 hypothetical protein MPTA5024_39380 [Microbispora sp. ATCC PTA-5024]
MTTPTPEFLPGLELSRILYEQAVRPILAEECPGLPYAAARLGPGSEVLGFDTARSTDHDWGPRLEVFLAPEAAAEHGAGVSRLLAERLPKQVRGWPTHFRRPDPGSPVAHMETTDGPVDHRVTVTDLGGWLTARLGFDPGRAEPATRDWLATPQQNLAEVTAGAVFHDGPGSLTAVRRRLAWYPDQVWRYLLACQWQRISQEEAFAGRCAEVGDDLGAALVAGRLARDLMRLCLLLGRRYAPYGKWLGSAYARLPVAGALTPSLRGAVAAARHPERERHLCDAYETVAALQNRSGLAEPVDPACRQYHGRPFRVLHAERFAHALAATLTDPALRALPLSGSVDQWADGTDLLGRREPVRAAVDALLRRSAPVGTPRSSGEDVVADHARGPDHPGRPAQVGQDDGQVAGGEGQ